MPKSRDSKKLSIEELIFLFENKANDPSFLAMDYKTVAKELGVDPILALDTMMELSEKGVLYRLAPSAEFMLNPKDMWRK